LRAGEGEKRGLREGEIAQISADGKSIEGRVKFDETVAAGTVVLPLGFEQEFPVHELGTKLMNGMPVEVKKK
jgi:anaerobic selenocysteine-containing dehydrogenase